MYQEVWKLFKNTHVDSEKVVIWRWLKGQEIEVVAIGRLISDVDGRMASVERPFVEQSWKLQWR